MDMERTEDFKALRAKFQNDSSFSNTLLHHAKKPLPEIIPRRSSDSSSASLPKPKPLHRVLQTPYPEQKMEQFSYALQKFEMLQTKPQALPRVRLHELSKVGRTENQKETGFPRTNFSRTASGVNSQMSRPTSCHYPEEAVMAKDSFHNTLHIRESTASHSDLKCSVVLEEVPPPRASRTTSLARSITDNVALAANFRIGTDQNENGLMPAVSKPPFKLQSDPVTVLAFSPPVPPRSHASLERAAKAPIRTSDCTHTVPDLDKTSKSLQCGNERQYGDEENRLPKTKPLPSIISLGPPPKKPPRPPKVELGIFRQNISALVDDAYMTPEITETDGLSKYEETISYLKEAESSTNSVPEATHCSMTWERKDMKKHFLTTPSTEKEDTKERGPSWNCEMPRHHQSKEISKISSHGRVPAKRKTTGEKYFPEEETMQVSPGTRETEDGNFSDDYVSLEVLKIDEETTSQDPDKHRLEQNMEDVYDDVAGMQREFLDSEASSPFTSDIFSGNDDETYEDIQSEGYHTPKPDDTKVEKLKGLGKLFKKGKYKMKNTPLKDNFRNLSSSVPNLDVLAQESMVYDNVSTEQNDTKEKSEIHKNWKRKFLTPKEKDRRRSSDDAEIPSSKNFFKVKKMNLDHDKMSKEEKLFRETFMYDKEITVINTAVSHCSNALTKGKLDLKITVGEELEVIDITEGNQLICRNAEGKYGYVLLEHLNFRH